VSTDIRWETHHWFAPVKDGDDGFDVCAWCGMDEEHECHWATLVCQRNTTDLDLRAPCPDCGHRVGKHYHDDMPVNGSMCSECMPNV
jgi:hypothetical protein